VAWWRAAGLLPPASSVTLASAAPVDRLLVLSGSCSPTTAEQVSRAIEAGFDPCWVDALRIADPGARRAEIDRVVEAAGRALKQGRDSIVYTAQSPDDLAIGQLREQCRSVGTSMAQAQLALGDALGEIARALAQRHALPRLVFAGGDTSGRIVEQLPIDALEAVFPLARGSPICRAYSADARFDGTELVLKGGQVGDGDFFISAKAGACSKQHKFSHTRRPR